VPVADAGAAADELKEEVVLSVLDAEVAIDDDVVMNAGVEVEDGVVLRVELAEEDWAEEDGDLMDMLVGEELVVVDVPETWEGEAIEEVVERGTVEDEAGEVDTEVDPKDVDTEDEADELLAELDAPPLALDPLATPVE
jgi:hypothetical protein